MEDWGIYVGFGWLGKVGSDGQSWVGGGDEMWRQTCKTCPGAYLNANASTVAKIPYPAAEMENKEQDLKWTGIALNLRV